MWNWLITGLVVGLVVGSAIGLMLGSYLPIGEEVGQLKRCQYAMYMLEKAVEPGAHPQALGVAQELIADNCR